MTTVRIPLGNAPDQFALVDQADLHLVEDTRWHIRRRPGDPDYVLAARTKRSMHRVILGVTDPTVYVDHINHDGLDNRRSNLRLATPGQSTANRRIRTDGRYIGVSPTRHGWVARIKKNGNTITIGDYPTAHEAAVARDAAAIRLFGDFACLNFPLEVSA